MWKKQGIFSLIILFVLVLSACSSSNESKDENDSKGKTVQVNTSEKQLVVGTDTSYMPFEFLDKATNQYVGFDIDLIDAILTGLELDYRLEPMDFNGIIPALQTNNLDIAIAGITKTDERAKVIDFSEGYYEAGTHILVQQSNTDINSVEDLAGKVIATKQGTSAYNYAIEIEGTKKVTPFPNIDQAYLELEKGAADAVVFDSPNVKYYAQTAGKGKVKVVGDLLQGQNFAIAFPKGSELREKVDQELAKLIEDGTYDEIYKKWFGE